MDTLPIFLIQLTLSVFVYALLAKWVITPWLNEKEASIALMILVAPHAMRHIGLTFMVPSVTAPNISESFALMTAWGDFITGLLAIALLFSIKHKWTLTLPLAWTFNVFGTIDLFKALSQADVVPTLEGTWYIPTFFVPLLLVSHYLIFKKLLKNPQKITE